MKIGASGVGTLVGMIALLVASSDATTVPAYAAYAEPRPEAIDVESATGTKGWDDPKEALVWYGDARSHTMLGLRVHLDTPAGVRYTMRINDLKVSAVSQEGTVDFGRHPVGAGKVRVALGTAKVPGPQVESLEATGDVRWNDSRRRNAASVHLRWPTPKGAAIRWFENEATMLTDPQWSYTMACGFARGYFGMQVNSPTERRIIFSVWDAGSEAVDRSKVGDENRVVLVAKGEGVEAGSFGNEGTGGHSHLVFPWRTGRPVRFLVGCRPEGERTLYAGYFMAPGDKAWRLVAAFRAPKDGGWLRDLYSFSEDFVGANGQRWRESAFGDGWVGLEDGSWQPLTRATFTTDGHGRTARWDYDAFVKDGRFHLRHGGFVPGTARYGDALSLANPGRWPKTALPTLPE